MKNKIKIGVSVVPVLFEMPACEYPKTREVIGKCTALGKELEG